MRDDSADTYPFLNGTMLYSNCVICMDLNNEKGTFVNKIKFSTASIGYGVFWSQARQLIHFNLKIIPAKINPRTLLSFCSYLVKVFLPC